MRRTCLTSLALTSLCLLSACGGGGGHGDGDGGKASAPSADIQFPPQVSLTDATTIAVRGTVESPGRVAHLMVRGVPAATTDGWQTWSATVPLVLGSNKLNVSMLDTDGNPIGADESVSVKRQDVVLGNCTGLAMDAAFSGRAFWLDAARGRVIHIDLPSGARMARKIEAELHPDTQPMMNPGEPVYDELNRVLCIPDGEWVHFIDPWTCNWVPIDFRRLDQTILDLDYLPANDMLVTLESRFDLNGDELLEIVELHVDTGLYEVLHSWNRTLGEGIPATRISLSQDGFNAYVASTNAVLMANFWQGADYDMDISPLSSIRDISRSFDDGWVSVLDGETGIHTFWKSGVQETLTALHPLDELSSPFTLSPGDGQDEYFVTDSVEDAVYRVDTDMGTVSLTAGSAMGSGPSPTNLYDETEFQCKRLAVDPLNDCVYSIASDGSRTEFARGGLLVWPVSLLATDDLLYVGCTNGLVVTIDQDGNQEIVFDAVKDLPQLRDLAFAPDDGKLIALGDNRLVEIDILTGGARVVSYAGDGMGPDFDAGVQVRVDSELRMAYVTSDRAVHSVSLDDGYRILLASDDPNSGSVGFGAPVRSPVALEFDNDTNSLLVAAHRGTERGCPEPLNLYRLDLATKERTEVNSAALGQGPIPGVAWSLEREASTGNLYMTGLREGALFVIDPISGDRVIASR